MKYSLNENNNIENKKTKKYNTGNKTNKDLQLSNKKRLEEDRDSNSLSESDNVNEIFILR